MSIRTRNVSIAPVLLALTVFQIHLTVFSQGTAFTYQGQLQNNGSLANGTYNLQFSLYANSTGGAAIAGPVATNGILVTNGLFTVSIDFGSTVWNGATNWLQIGVETNGAAPFSPLTPRQHVTPTPYAIFSEGANAAGLSGTVPMSSLTGTYGGALSLTNAGNSFTGNGNGLTNVNAVALDGLPAGDFWQVGGNSGVPTGNNYIGNNDNQYLDIRANGIRVFRLRLFTDGLGLYTNAPNVIGGSSVNLTASAVVGATIAGGGGNDTNGNSLFNEVYADFGTIGGGYNNRVDSLAGTVSGGSENNITTNGVYGFIGGGLGNSAGYASAIGGGWDNVAGDYYNTVAGGQGNQAIGDGSTVGGGADNITSGNDSTVGGGDANNASADLTVIGGGIVNTNSGIYSAICGGYGNYVGGAGSFIGGGGFDGASFSGNYIDANAAAIAGGWGNSIPSGSRYAFIGGGQGNRATAYYATVAGGATNQAEGEYSMVPGGVRSTAYGTASFAAGNTAVASYNGSFIWADDTGLGTYDTSENQFVARASGGFYFYTGTGSAGAALGSGSTSWSILCDRHAKKNFKPVDTVAVLDKLTAVPIEQWNYKWEKDTDTPNIGPMAQDFKKAFYPGRDDKSITTLEFDGVELAAIQGLNQKLEEQNKDKDAEIAALSARLEKLEQLVNTLKGDKQ